MHFFMNRLRLKIFTPMLAETKMLISKIKEAAHNTGQRWLFIKDIDGVDKRANIGLLLYEMSEAYSGLGPEDKFEVEVAPSLGREALFINKLVIICCQVSTRLTTI